MYRDSADPFLRMPVMKFYIHYNTTSITVKSKGLACEAILELMVEKKKCNCRNTCNTESHAVVPGR